MLEGFEHLCAFHSFAATRRDDPGRIVVGHDDTGFVVRRSCGRWSGFLFLLLGRLRIQGDRCVMQFELIRSRDFLHLASFQYEGGREELAMIRDRLQRDLFLRLQGESRRSGDLLERQPEMVQQLALEAHAVRAHA